MVSGANLLDDSHTERHRLSKALKDRRRYIRIVARHMICDREQVTFIEPPFGAWHDLNPFSPTNRMPM
jgi:hypothetical protein